MKYINILRQYDDVWTLSFENVEFLLEGVYINDIGKIIHEVVKNE